MDIYAVLSHPTRRQLLQILDREGYVKHSDLMARLKIETTGKLNFHIKQLETLILKEPRTGAYYLSDEGKQAITVIEFNDRIMRGESILDVKTASGHVNRMGVIICNCTGEVSDCLDVAALEQFARRLPDVVSVRVFDNLCQERYLKGIHAWCKDQYMNKVAIAGCSPKTHQHTFEAMFDGLIEKQNIEIVNIREHCAWVHGGEGQREAALKKAQALVEAGVARLALQGQIKSKTVQVEKSCAVIGGGIAGMTVALQLAKAGIPVHLIEKSPTLGGWAARWSKMQDMADCSICFISELVGELAKQKNIHVHTNTTVENVSGEVGNFSLDLVTRPRYIDETRCTGCGRCMSICTVEKDDDYEFGMDRRKQIYIPFSHAYPYAAIIDEGDLDSCKECRVCERACVNRAIDLDQEPQKLRIKVGAKVMAVGLDFEICSPGSVQRDPAMNVISSADLERVLSADGPTAGKLVRLPDGRPPASIAFIMPTLPRYGVARIQAPVPMEEQLHAKHVLFAREQLRNARIDTFHASNVTVEPREDGAVDVIESSGKHHAFDLVVLGVTMVPNKDLRELRKRFDFTIDDTGFMSEETLSSGIFGAGAVTGPMSYRDILFSASKATVEIMSLLAKERLVADMSVIENNPDKCGKCGLCVKSCPYNAISIEPDHVVIDKFKCKGCGTCVAACPTGAMEMNVDSTEKITRSIEVLAKLKMAPRVLAFCCKSCGYAAADNAGIKKQPYPPNAIVLKVPCSGRVNTGFIIHALEAGFDGVMVIGCKEDACRYIDGFEKARRRVALLKEAHPWTVKRVRIQSMSAVEGSQFAGSITTFVGELREAGGGGAT